MNYTYVLLLLFSILVPLAYSFNNRIKYYKNFASLFPALFIVAGFFLAWDFLFTRWKVWAFNDEYIMGYKLGGMPIEEWMFFIVIPYCCVFIYESLTFYFKKDYLAAYAKRITQGLIILLFVIAILDMDNVYTTVTFLLTACVLLFTYASGKMYMGRFYIAYLVHLIPFFIVNGVLTAMPVVIYNENEILGIRLGTIPLEDSIYSMVLLLMNIIIYEYLKAKKYAAMISSNENIKRIHQD